MNIGNTSPSVPVGLSDKFDANVRHRKLFLAGVVLVPVRPHHAGRQETLPIQQPGAANAAAAAAAVGSMTLNDVLRGTYHARPDRLQEVGGRAVRRRPGRAPRTRSVVLRLDSSTISVERFS